MAQCHCYLVHRHTLRFNALLLDDLDHRRTRGQNTINVYPVKSAMDPNTFRVPGIMRVQHHRYGLFIYKSVTRSKNGMCFSKCLLLLLLFLLLPRGVYISYRLLHHLHLLSSDRVQRRWHKCSSLAMHSILNIYLIRSVVGLEWRPRVMKVGSVSQGTIRTVLCMCRRTYVYVYCLLCVTWHIGTSSSACVWCEHTCVRW